jgi:hypothetical protein
MQWLKHNKISAILCMLAAVFSIKALREPDIWWQLRTGQWIIANNSVPHADNFSSLASGRPWINIKWGWEWFIAHYDNFFGIDSIVIVQVIVSMLIMLFVVKLCTLYMLPQTQVSLLSLIICVLAMQYRFVSRPEMMSHLLSLLYFYITNRSQTKGDIKVLYLLPFLQIIWCNMHEAFGMGNIIIFIGLFASLLNYKSKIQLTKHLGLVATLSVLSNVINPRGVKLLASPFDIFNQVNTNKYTTELANFLDPVYWRVESFIFISILAVVIYSVLSNKKIILNRFTNFYWLGACAMVLIAFLAYRNIIFAIMFLSPAFVHSMQQLWHNLSSKFSGLRKIKRLSIPYLMATVIYGAVITNNYYGAIGSNDRYGAQILSSNTPVAAVNFIKSKGLDKYEGFADYLGSSYAMYSLQPNFKSYLDLRDLDVFTSADFEQYKKIFEKPEQFLVLDKKENYKYALLVRKNTEPLQNYLHNDSIYACVYVDAVAAVYEKTDNFSNEDIYSYCENIDQSTSAQIVSLLFNPFFKPYNYEALPYDYDAASYYFNAGRVRLAISRINRYINNYPDDPKGPELLSAINEAVAKQKAAGK